MKIIKSILITALPLLLLASCRKYRDVNDAAYPDQTVYFPAAVNGVSTNGIYFINSVATPGFAFRYVADVAAKKLNIPLAVYRAGVNTKGSTTVSIALNTDTVSKFLAAGKFPTGTEALPADKYTFDNSATITDGSDEGNFKLSVDLNFLLANPTKKYAVGLGLSTSSKGLAPSSVLIILIDPSFLLPAANFSTTVSGKTVTFSNTSTNAANYSWNYGDGSAPSTAAAASYTYAAAGTYTITLTATGALGAFNPAVKTATVTVQ